ncbi:MAG: hypothetical protein Q9227_001277 [Pyrenula ochraceoflavens]
MSHSVDYTSGLKADESIPKSLRPLSRFVTTHNSYGEAVFSSALAEAAPVEVLPKDAHFSLLYTTSSHPVNMAAEEDVADYAKYIENPPGIVVKGGTVCRVVDMIPGSTSPMHRTVSLDYGVVIEGEVECVLDSGEVRLLKRGDVCVQRGMLIWITIRGPSPAFILTMLTRHKPCVEECNAWTRREKRWWMGKNAIRVARRIAHRNWRQESWGGER